MKGFMFPFYPFRWRVRTLYRSDSVCKVDKPTSGCQMKAVWRLLWRWIAFLSPQNGHPCLLDPGCLVKENLSPQSHHIGAFLMGGGGVNCKKCKLHWKILSLPTPTYIHVQTLMHPLGAPTLKKVDCDIDGAHAAVRTAILTPDLHNAKLMT